MPCRCISCLGTMLYYTAFSSLSIALGKVVILSSLDYVYVIEMIDYLEYNVLWKIPNDDNLNDAIARKRRRR